jgi:hypothetical protein
MHKLLALAAPLFLAAPHTLRAQFIPIPIPIPYPRSTPPQIPPTAGPESHHSVALAGFIAIGGQGGGDPTAASAVAVPTAGLYAEWTRHILQPGLELRAVGGGRGVLGTLVGPRLSLSYKQVPFHPYVAALFGPNHILYSANNLPPTIDRHGVTRQFTIGLEEDLGHFVRWRVVDFSKGTFDGIPNSSPQSWTTGIVLRIP